jgi:glycerol kinase
VGIANQGESCLGWDAATGEPVGPVIVWQDDRTAEVTDRLRAEGCEAMVQAAAGLPLDPYFSAAKLGWILRENRTAQRLHALGRLRLGTTDAFFRDRLAGRFETDVTTASRTSLMNLGTRDWDPALCALFGVPRECLPAITATTGALGVVGGLPLTASVVDQQAALHGHGCRKPGDAKITFGTGAFALALTGELRAAEGVLPTVAWARAGEAAVHAVDGGVYAASAAVNWARGLGLFKDWAEIDDFAAEPAIARGIAFVPALSGLACPHWDRRARGAWMGLGLDTGPRDMAQAVLEGVAFRMAEVMARMAEVVPLSGPVSIDGGMSANPWFCGFLSAALGRPVMVSGEPELTAVGTAELAAHGAGMTLDLPRRGRLVTADPAPAAWHARFAAARMAVQGFGAAG